MSRVVLTLAALVLAACTASLDSSTGQPCAMDADCTGGAHCYRSFCVGGSSSACTVEGATQTCSARGAPGLVRVGICSPGQQLCTGGVWGECTGEVFPAATDPCNGADDDCDNATDENPPETCEATGIGLCGVGEPDCTSGTIACMVVNEPTLETCDGLDQDCDASTDEGLDEACFESGASGCTTDGSGVFTCTGICAAGRVECEGGEPTDCQGSIVPVAEVCDEIPALDDDCDGDVDEGCACTGSEMQDCYPGPESALSAGAGCRLGTQTCSGGVFGACMGAVLPSPETCANPDADDDCNGTPDDVPGLGASCMVPAEGVCRIGVQVCDGDALACSTPDPSIETCDGRDEDCDAMTDEGFDLMNDRMHCGACDVACGDGFECCSGTCAALDSSAMNCGACGRACDLGQGCCGGTCFDVEIDEMNCGVCGNVCGAGQTCCGGACVDTSSSTANCGACGTVCPGTTSCCGSACVPPSSPACIACSPACTGGRVCCGGTCVDPTTDEMNCGGCAPPIAAGDTCSPTEVCCGGTCGPRDTPSECGGSCASCSDLCCGGTCVTSDNTNCHACGVACSAGTCCATGCVNTMTDDRNCGGCAIDCVAVGQQCDAGHCCPTGEVWCGAAGCQNLVNNRDHCGMCGRACLLGCSGTLCI